MLRSEPPQPGTVGRFAPSPTGALHVGNLRTALVAWLAARAEDGAFIVRMEDLDRVTSSRDHERDQLAALEALGLHHDGPVVRQSERFDRYEAAIEQLRSDGRTYPCFCTRREIREAIDAAAGAPHGSLPAYPGTCRDLSRTRRAGLEAEGRRPALRLRTEPGDALSVTGIVDERCGPVAVEVDDVVLRRNDGVPAYNLAVVVDDDAQAVTQVVRGDDLLSSTPRQVLLQRLLGLATPRYLHVPLVVGGDGIRLAKRHGAVTLADLAARGIDASAVVGLLAVSLGLAEPGEPVTPADLVPRFDRARIPGRPWVIPADLQRSEP